MDKNNLGKVRSIPVQEIIEIQRENFYKDLKIASARKELKNYLLEIGSKYALTIGGYVKALRNLEQPPITLNLKDYIKNKNYFQLRRLISSLLIACHGDGYSSFELHKGWKREKRGLFWYYYYMQKDFLNIYSISDEDLPLYVSHEFATEEDKSLYLKRLEMLYVSKEER
jgi:hypothetical protein